MKNRRTAGGYKLRVYIDAIKEVKSMTDQQWLGQWVAEWVNRRSNAQYIPRLMWLSYLESCALIEAEQFATKEAA